MTVWYVLKKHQVKTVVKRRKKSACTRYSKEILGERAQLDVMKVRNVRTRGIYAPWDWA